MASPMRFVDYFNYQIKLMDDKNLYFGNSDDISVDFTDGTGLQIKGTGSAESLLIGDNTYAIDVKQGTSAAKMALSAGTPLYSLYSTSSAITSTVQSQVINQTMTAAATASQVEALRVEIESDVKTGAWANAIMAQIDYKTSGAAHGMAATVCAEMVPPNSSLSRGALYALDLEFGCGASSSWASAGPVAFMKMENWGTATHFSANAFLFHLAGETSATGNLLYTNSIKIRIGTSTEYLVYSDAEQGLHLGTSASKNTLVASTPFLSTYTTSSAATGALQSVIISQTMTAASTTNQVEVLKVQLVSDVKTGAWAQAIFAQTDYSTNGLAHGAGSVICAELSLPGSSVTRGTYYVWQSEIDCPASCAMNSNPIGVMSVSVWGDNATQFDDVGLLFDISGVTVGSGKFFSTATNTTIDHALKCRIGGTTYWIGLYDATT